MLKPKVDGSYMVTFSDCPLLLGYEIRVGWEIPIVHVATCIIFLEVV